MNILIAKRPILQFGPRFSTQNHLFHDFHSSPPCNKIPECLNFSKTRSFYFPRIITFCSNTASDPLSCYGGWDHPQFGGNFDHPSEYNQLQSFLISIGIADKKYLFVYILGFVCALAVSRVKVSSIIIFPACALVFAVGFSLGFFNGGHTNLIGAKKRPKNEGFRESIEKLGDLVDLLRGFDVNIENLKKGIQKRIDCNHVSLNDLGSFLATLESFDLAIVNAKGIAEDCMGSLLAEYQDKEANLNQKSIRKKKEVIENEFNLNQFFVNLFQEKSTSPRSIKMKDSSKRESTNVEVNHKEQANVLASSVKVRTSKSLLDENVEDGRLNINDKNKNKAENLINRAWLVDAISQNKNRKFAEMDSSVNAVLKSNKYIHQKRRLDFKSNQETSLKASHAMEVERWESEDDLFDSLDFRASLQHQKTETEFGQEQKREIMEGVVQDFGSIENGKTEAYGSVAIGKGMIPDSEPTSVNHDSMVSEDMEFSRYLVEANTLLKGAKECLVQQVDDEVAEIYLCKSAELLLKAKTLRPMSLLAVGQLGNTYLLHGELKLRLTRDLRALLDEANPAAIDEWYDTDDLVSRKDKISSILVNVCDECEVLLVSAGRNYRLALSIDGNDVKAMYNWGLALFYRAQLIADIGPSAAHDADKVFLAAIDKFDAMMSKSNIHAPDALFRWGAALQQRSRLRPRNRKEKVKLLLQARRLYEDALDFDSDNIRAQEALSSCVSELKYWYD